MKRLIFSCLAALLVLVSCQNKTKSFMEGVYVSYETGEYSISKDTLVIRKFAEDEYQIIRKSTFQTIRNGKLQPQQQKIREYMGRFEPKTKVLVLDAQGKQITFFLDKGSLLFAQRVYTKVIKD